MGERKRKSQLEALLKKQTITGKTTYDDIEKKLKKEDCWSGLDEDIRKDIFEEQHAEIVVEENKIATRDIALALEETDLDHEATYEKARSAMSKNSAWKEATKEVR